MLLKDSIAYVSKSNVTVGNYGYEQVFQLCRQICL